MADWEPAHALCEIKKSGRFEVVAVGFSDEIVTTMGGLRVVPDISVEAMDPADAAIFILPGGDMWEQRSNEAVTSILRQFHKAAVPVAAICAATLEIARARLTGGVRHTSNGKQYLKAMVPDYADEDSYVELLAVGDKGVITASGLGSVEFGREIIKQLELYGDKDTALWFDMFKHGILPIED